MNDDEKVKFAQDVLKIISRAKNASEISALGIAAVVGELAVLHDTVNRIADHLGVARRKDMEAQFEETRGNFLRTVMQNVTNQPEEGSPSSSGSDEALDS
jgi:hypothetical protein